MRGKAAQQQMADSVLRGVNKLENHLREVREVSSVSPPPVERPRNAFDSKYESVIRNEFHQQEQVLQQQQLQQQREQEEQQSAAMFSNKTELLESQIIRDETAQALRLQRVVFEENSNKRSVSPPVLMSTHRERTKESTISGGSMDNYMKCMENVIVQYQKHAEEGRLAEFSELCKRASDQDYAHLGRLSPSTAGMGLNNKTLSKMNQRQQHPQDLMSSSTPSSNFGVGSSNSAHQHLQQHNSGSSNRNSLMRHQQQQQSNFVYDALEFSPTSTSSQMQQPLLQARLSAPHKTSTLQDRDNPSSFFSSHLHGGLLPFKARDDAPTVISDDDDDEDDDDDDESVSSDSTICPESPPLVISYTKDTLNEFCTRQYQSLLDDVEQPLKQVLASEDEDTAAKRKLIVLEQRVKRKLKMKFAGFDSEAKRAKLEAAASAVAAGSSSYSSLSRMSELSALGSPSATTGAGGATGTTQVSSCSTSSSAFGDNAHASSSPSVGGITTPHKYELPMSSSTPLVDSKPQPPIQTTPRNKPTVSRVLQRKNTPSPGSSLPNPSTSLRHSEMENISSSHSMFSQQPHKNHSHPQHHPMTHPSSHSTYTAKGSGSTAAPANAPHYGGTGAHGQGVDALKVCTTDSRRSVHLSTDDLVSGQRVLLRQADGLYAPGKLIAMQPPDIYGILVDGARGSKPQVFPYEELVRKAVLEIVPRNKGAIPKGTKVCAYFNRSFTVLHPGTVSFSSTKTLPHAIKIEFDDGEESIVNLSDVRILSSLFNPVDYNILTPLYSPDSNCNTGISGQQGTTSGLRNRNRKVVSIWRWDQKCLKETPLSKNIKAFYSSIKKADGQVYKDDFVAFHNSAPNSAMRRPYIGKVINFFETAAGENFVKVSWYYHTEETKQGINTALPKNALLRSNHTDELDIQTISHKVEVLDQAEYMKFNQNIYMAAQAKGTSPDHLFVCAGTYDYIKGLSSLTFKKSSSSPSYSSIASTSSASSSSSHFDPVSDPSSLDSRSDQQQVNLPPESSVSSNSSSSSGRLRHSNMEMKDRAASSSRVKPC